MMAQRLSSLWVCLFGSETGWMKNFEVKMGKNFFGMCLVGWGGRKINGGA